MRVLLSSISVPWSTTNLCHIPYPSCSSCFHHLFLSFLSYSFCPGLNVLLKKEGSLELWLQYLHISVQSNFYWSCHLSSSFPLYLGYFHIYTKHLDPYGIRSLHFTWMVLDTSPTTVAELTQTGNTTVLFVDAIERKNMIFHSMLDFGGAWLKYVSVAEVLGAQWEGMVLLSNTAARALGKHLSCTSRVGK